MNTRCLSAILAVTFLAAGLPSGANAAFYYGTDPLISGQASFTNPSSQLYGHVDYAVYSPGYFIWSDSFPDQFFYCYQIFNSSESSNIARFTVNLDSDVTAYSPGDFVFSEGDISPLAIHSNSTTVAYLFISSYCITANHNSSVLFFACDFGPGTDSGTIIETVFGSTFVQIPAPATEPIPEPASLLILALAAPALLKTRKRKS